MENISAEWGVVQITHPGFAVKGELVRLHRHKDNPIVIWEVETHNKAKRLSFMIYYEELEITSEAEREMYKMLYPNWNQLL